MARRRAFTLIELLVVIAILALLVSILMPSLMKAKDMARQTGCLMNLHHLGTVTALYTTEYRTFPYNTYPSEFGYNYWSIYAECLEFVMNANHGLPATRSPRCAWQISSYTRKLIRCPADVGPDLVVYPPSPRETSPYTISYSENKVLYTNMDAWKPAGMAPWGPWVKADQIDRPQNTLLLMEGFWWELYPFALEKATALWVNTLWVRHWGGLTANFVDGHAEVRLKPLYNRGMFWGVNDPSRPFPDDQRVPNQ